jgi:hypothetical protein
MVLTDDITETGQFAGLELQTEKIGYIPKGCQDADQLSAVALHAGNTHFHPTQFATLGRDAQGVLRIFSDVWRIVTELTATSAKRMAECFMTVLANYFLTVIAGYTFSFMIEEKNLPVQIVRDNPFFETVQNMLQVIAMTH